MEIIVMREAFKMTGNRNIDKILIENDSQLIINSIKGLIKVPNQVIKHVIDTLNLARNFNNI